jgi:hypothetical protein
MHIKSTFFFGHGKAAFNGAYMLYVCGCMWMYVCMYILYVHSIICICVYLECRPSLTCMICLKSCAICVLST